MVTGPVQKGTDEHGILSRTHTYSFKTCCLMKNQNVDASQFKPVEMLDGPRFDDLLQTISVEGMAEVYPEDVGRNHKGAPKLKKGLVGFFPYRLHIGDDYCLVREVDVEGKEEFSHAYIFEWKPEDIGLCLVYFRDNRRKVVGETWCNLRYFPHTRLREVLQINGGQAGKLPLFTIPQHNVVKLNVTIRAAFTGELQYHTHKAQVLLEGMSNEERKEAEESLSFQAAPLITYLYGEMANFVGRNIFQVDEAGDKRNREEFIVEALSRKLERENQILGDSSGIETRAILEQAKYGMKALLVGTYYMCNAVT